MFRKRSGVRRPTNAWHVDSREGRLPRAISRCHALSRSRLVMRWRFDMRTLEQFRIADHPSGGARGLRISNRRSSIRNPKSEIRNRNIITGVTLIELLVVIAIIGVLVAILLPAV